MIARDALHPEPPPRESPPWSHPKVTIMPRVAQGVLMVFLLPACAGRRKNTRQP